MPFVRAKAFAFVAGAAVTLYPLVGHAGPCSDDIADVGRKLAQSASRGPATTGTLFGANPGAIQSMSDPAQTVTPSAIGTSATNQVGGTAGTKELNAAVGQVATSAQDVRAQQQGLPTAAQVAAQGPKSSVETTPQGSAPPQSDDHMSEAKMELEKARMLDQKDDGACADAVKHARDLMGG